MVYIQRSKEEKANPSTKPDLKLRVDHVGFAAENNILKAQNNIDDLIIEREPLESKMIKLEAEVGPVKYIASLVVDWGVTTEVDTSEAVRWVILIIIFVFDPLAVLLLVAANQSLIRRFPVDPPPPPDEIIDLEKPELDDIIAKPNNDTEDEWNSLIEKATIEAQKEQLNKKVNAYTNMREQESKSTFKVERLLFTNLKSPKSICQK